ncbi:adhesion G-protein coupled receptor G4 isoform X2 [Sardina pilchardus]|uniref:adhesion G-protein coupled receptor G4 isoform X2 n=1 Tax=Sardina pilchardus TaxID=27697 RepID=UPI002E0EF304
MRGINRMQPGTVDYLSPIAQSKPVGLLTRLFWLWMIHSSVLQAHGYFMYDSKAVLGDCQDYWTFRDRERIPLLFQVTVCVDVRVVSPGPWLAFSYSSPRAPRYDLALEGDAHSLHAWLLGVRHRFPVRLAPRVWHRLCLRRDSLRNTFSLEVDGRSDGEHQRTVIARLIPPSGELTLGCQPWDAHPGAPAAAPRGKVELYLFRMWGDVEPHGACEDGSVAGWESRMWAVTHPRAKVRDDQLYCGKTRRKRDSNSDGATRLADGRDFVSTPGSTPLPKTTPTESTSAPQTTPTGTPRPLATPTGTTSPPQITPTGSTSPPQTIPAGSTSPPQTTPTATPRSLTTPTETTPPPQTTPTGRTLPPQTTSTGTPPPQTTPTGTTPPTQTTLTGSTSPPQTTPTGTPPPQTTPTGSTPPTQTALTGSTSPPQTTPTGTPPPQTTPTGTTPPIQTTLTGSTSPPQTTPTGTPPPQTTPTGTTPPTQTTLTGSTLPPLTTLTTNARTISTVTTAKATTVSTVAPTSESVSAKTTLPPTTGQGTQYPPRGPGSTPTSSTVGSQQTATEEAHPSKLPPSSTSTSTSSPMMTFDPETTATMASTTRLVTAADPTSMPTESTKSPSVSTYPPVTATTKPTQITTITALLPSTFSSSQTNSTATPTARTQLSNHTTDAQWPILDKGPIVMECNFSQFCSNTTSHYWMMISVTVEGQARDKTEKDIEDWLHKSISHVESIEINCADKTNITRTNCTVELGLSEPVNPCDLKQQLQGATNGSGINVAIYSNVERVGKGLCVDEDRLTSGGGFVRCTYPEPYAGMCTSNQAVNVTCSAMDSDYVPAPSSDPEQDSCAFEQQDQCNCESFCNDTGEYYYALRLSITSPTINATGIQNLIFKTHADCDSVTNRTFCENITQAFKHFREIHLECHGNETRLHNCMVALMLDKQLGVCEVNRVMAYRLHRSGGVSYDGRLSRMAMCGGSNSSGVRLLDSNLSWFSSSLTVPDFCDAKLRTSHLTCQKGETKAVLLNDVCHEPLWQGDQSKTTGTTTAVPQSTAQSNTTAVPPTTTQFNTTAVPPTTTQSNTTAVPQNTTQSNTTAVPQNTTQFNTTAVPQNTTQLNTTAVPQNTAQFNTTTVPQNTTQSNTTAVPQNTTQSNTTAVPQNTAQFNITAVPQNTAQFNTTAVPQKTTQSNTTAVPQNITQFNTTAVPQNTTQFNTTVVPQNTIQNTTQYNTTAVPWNTTQFNTTSVPQNTIQNTTQYNTTAVSRNTTQSNTTAVPPTTTQYNTTAVPRNTTQYNTTAVAHNTTQFYTTAAPQNTTQFNTTDLLYTSQSNTTLTQNNIEFNGTTLQQNSTQFYITTVPPNATQFNTTGVSQNTTQFTISTQNSTLFNSTTVWWNNTLLNTTTPFPLNTTQMYTTRNESLHNGTDMNTTALPTNVTQYATTYTSLNSTDFTTADASTTSSHNITISSPQLNITESFTVLPSHLNATMDYNSTAIPLTTTSQNASSSPATLGVSSTTTGTNTTLNVTSSYPAGSVLNQTVAMVTTSEQNTTRQHENVTLVPADPDRTTTLATTILTTPATTTQPGPQPTEEPPVNTNATVPAQASTAATTTDPEVSSRTTVTTVTTETTIATTTTPSASEQANQLLNQTRDVSSLNSSQVAELVEQLEEILSGPSVSPEVAQAVLSIVSNLLDADPSTLGSSSNGLIQAVDTVGQKVEIEDDSTTIETDSLVVSATRVDGDSFNGGTFTIANQQSARATVRSVRRSRRSERESALDDGDLGMVTLPSTLTENLSPEELKLFSRIQFNFFFKTTFFQDQSLDQLRLNSRILSASASNLSISNLTEDVEIILRNEEPIPQNATAVCMFWDFSKNGGSGGWNSEGCSVKNTTKNATICSCNHLTSFAVLLDLSGQGITDRLQATILSFITYIGCGVSAIFLAITLLTYLLFEKLRRDIPSKILIQLCFALLMLNLVFLLDSWLALYTDAVGLCISTAFFLHYFLLVSFTWMGLEAMHMYLAIVKVFNNYMSRYMLKFSLMGWGIPLPVVIIVISVDKNNYGLVNYGKYADGTTDDFCWFKNDIAFYVGVVAYFCVVFVLNLAMFVVVMVQLNRVKRQNPQNNQHRSRVHDLRSVAGLTFLLGLTWGFAFFAWGPVNLAFMYLFAIFNSLQGFFIFIFHCALKDNVRRQWRTYLCCGSLRLAENSDWSRTATQNNTKKTSLATTSSVHSSNSGLTQRASRNSSMTSDVLEQSNGIRSPFEDSVITALEDTNGDVVLNEINNQHSIRRRE